jgi:hypothetical protein
MLSARATFGERRDRFVFQIGRLVGAGEEFAPLDVNLGKVHIAS